MSTVYSHSYDAYTTNATTDGSWDDAQGSATTDGGTWVNNSIFSNYGVFCKNAGSRGGDDYGCYRSYFVFDLSSESGTVESATISIYLDNLGSTIGHREKVLLVEATAFQSIGGGVEDHGNVFQSGGGGTTWHDDISDIISVSTTIGYHVFTMNSDGIALIQDKIDSSGTMTVGLVGWYHDYEENVPNPGGEYTQIKVGYSEQPASPRDPKMDIIYAAVVSADNATFFGANF
jgi:hypothetical protein